LSGYNVLVTEKLDGSNLAIFKLDGEMYIAQRNNIFSYDEFGKTTYKGLPEWLEQNKETLLNSIIDGVAICGEWLATGNIKYGIENTFHMFAKARIGSDFALSKFCYDTGLLDYAFIEQSRPYCIDSVPMIARVETLPSVEILNALYEKYTSGICSRSVEGFVVSMGENIWKYVRAKGTTITPHTDGILEGWVK
jgi:hypothetical protein